MAKFEGPTRWFAHFLVSHFFQKSRRGGWILFFLFALLLTLIMNVNLGQLPTEVQEGTIASRDILADQNYSIADKKKTEKLREESPVKSIPDQFIHLKKNQSIVRHGDRYTEWHVTVMEGIGKVRSKTYFKSKMLGTFLFVSLILFLFYNYGTLFIKNFKPNRVDLISLSLFVCLTLLIQRLFFILADPIRNDMPFALPATVFFYGVPIAFGAMLIRLIMTNEVALFFALTVSLFAGSVHENNLLYTVFYLVTSITGAALISHTRSRLHILSASFWTGVVSMLFVGILSLVSSASNLQIVTRTEVYWGMAAALASGITSCMLIFIFIPVAEGLFGYLTDVKLMELGSLNHPLLRDLVVKAPGTNFHCHMVGTLAEAGAEAIGANGLFARVASYYHDIGKMTKADHFIENQDPHQSPHLNLSPSTSALVIAAHVKDGVEMGKAHRLPEKIIDIIVQHQGTKLVGFFFNKIKEQEMAQYDRVISDERYFRYPGPKPQTREAGVILLADTVEAATRSVRGQTPAKIEELVRHMINRNFIDGQLDECDLTLKDLNAIAQAFVRVVISIYHQRIEYPEPPQHDRNYRDERDKYSKLEPLAKDFSSAGSDRPVATLSRIKS